MTSLLQKTTSTNKRRKGDSFIQPKLKIGKPNDRYEQEADRTADHVINKKTDSLPKIQKMEAGQEEELQMKCAACEQEEQLQTKSNTETALPNIESQLSATKGSGQPMENNIRAEMEAGFGTDFSKVRIHNNSNAIQMSQQLNAQAFTNGNDIYFNSGKYDTNSQSGKHLLAHELTHTIQQGGAEIKKYDWAGPFDYGMADRTEESEPEIVRGVCGPDITTELSSAISRFTSDYNALSSSEKTEVCDTIDSLTAGTYTWDIVELHNNAWIYQNYRPDCATQGAQPPCGSTVQVDDQCFYAGSVNYVIFGVMCKLCGISKSYMNTLIWLYKRSSGNYATSKKWANAGYDGWSPGGNTPTGDRNSCEPTCALPFTGPTFNTRLCPHIDPYSQCPSTGR